MLKLSVTFLKEVDLIGGKTIALDGTRQSRAHNSKKIITPPKVRSSLNTLKKRLKEYLSKWTSPIK
ncbi:MAG: hypothetical protein IPP71_09250 [Bacteroidetes bacterium]|nr:hypothetical protein [Bacteroidota bacterium]